jgi:hypothetical protein
MAVPRPLPGAAQQGQESRDHCGGEPDPSQLTAQDYTSPGMGTWPPYHRDTDTYYYALRSKREACMLGIATTAGEGGPWSDI